MIQTRRVSAKGRLQRLEKEPRPGTASDFIRHFASLIRNWPVTKVVKVVLYCRVSVRQNKKHLKHQEEKLSAAIDRIRETRIVVVIARIHETISGWKVDAEDDRPLFVAAIAKARKHGAVVLAETPDRFIRSIDFSTRTNADAQPTKEDFQCLARMAGDVMLATLLVPDVSPQVVRSYQRKRGQWATGRKGGRPKSKKPGYKKQRRLTTLTKVFWLSKCGFSVRGIAKLLGTPPQTIQDWIRKLH